MVIFVEEELQKECLEEWLWNGAEAVGGTRDPPGGKDLGVR